MSKTSGYWAIDRSFKCPKCGSEKGKKKWTRKYLYIKCSNCGIQKKL